MNGVNWRASEASETLSGVYKFKLVQYMYVCIYIYICMYVCVRVYGGMYVCRHSSACYTYVMWDELGHCYFLYVPAISNVTTTNGARVLKLEPCALVCVKYPVFCLRRYYRSESKPILYLDTV